MGQINILLDKGVTNKQNLTSLKSQPVGRPLSASYGAYLFEYINLPISPILEDVDPLPKQTSQRGGRYEF